MRRLCAPLLLVLAGALATATIASAGQVVVPRGEPVQIAVVLDHSGVNAALGAAARNAVQMAVEKHSQIRGFPIQLNDFDGPCGLGPEVPTANAAAAAAVVANPQNVAVIGHFCSSGFAAALPIYQAAGVVTLSGSATSPILPLFGPDVFNSLAVPDGQFDPWYETVLALPSDNSWRERYQDEFGSSPGPFADLYYDAASVMLDQIADSATLDHGNLVIDRTALAQAVRSTVDFRGVTCDITLDSQGFRVNDAASLAKCARTGNGH